MLVVMKKDATEEQVQAVIREIENLGSYNHVCTYTSQYTRKETKIFFFIIHYNN